MEEISMIGRQDALHLTTALLREFCLQNYLLLTLYFVNNDKY